MGEPYDSDKPNGSVPAPEEDENSNQTKEVRIDNDDETLYQFIHRLIAEIFIPDQSNKGSSLIHRFKISFAENGPIIRHSFQNAARDILLWTRRGSPLRSLLVISVGTIALLALTGLFSFLLFFLVATLYAIVVSLLVSLAVAGGFLVLFFTCLTAVYIGALSVAVFVISTATISAIVAVLIGTGWTGFFCVVWMAMRKSFGLAKHSLSASSSAISAFSQARRSNKD